MLTVSLVLAAAVIGGDRAQARLPLTRVTLLRDAGSWLQWEGEVARPDDVLIPLTCSVDASTITVERADGDDWRAIDYAIEPMHAASTTAKETKAPGRDPPSLRLSAPGGAKAAKLRVRAFSAAFKWRPAYMVELGKEPKMSMRCLVHSAEAVDTDVALECIASSATPRGGETDYWSDSTIYPLASQRLGRGDTSLSLFQGRVEAEEYVAVELGGMAGEPGVKPARDRAVSMLRLSNRSTKTWPTGELLVTNEGRLIARVILPHTDAGRSADVALGAAVGVAVLRDEIELDRKTAVVRRETDPPDSIQTAGSATVSNHTGRSLLIRATKTVAGDATGASDDAKIVRTPNRIGAEQPLNEIRWSFSLAAGQSKRITFGTIIRLSQPSEAKDPRQ